MTGYWPGCSRRAVRDPAVRGHPDGLLGATASLLEWASQEDLTWDMTSTPDGERWAARLEIYETDPAVEPDMAKWTTQLAFRLSD